VNISKFVTPEIIFGQGALSQLGESALRLGASKVFVVSDDGVIGAGWVDRALGFLHGAGLETEVFAALTTNPKDFEVTAGVELYQASGCDAIVAVRQPDHAEPHRAGLFAIPQPEFQRKPRPGLDPAQRRNAGAYGHAVRPVPHRVVRH
jgi:1,3-propanediol dehydrogenase